MTEWIIENKDWIVPISVALLSLFGSLLGGWLSGKKRIGIEVLSKNRQEWINDLRKKVSEFTSLTEKASLDITRKKMTTKYDINDQQEIIEIIFNLMIIRDYLILLLNPNEENSKLIYANIRNILALIQAFNNMDRQSLLEGVAYRYAQNILVEIEKLTKNTQLVLKTEWERVKKGI